MKPSERIWGMVMALLLTLAVALIWPPAEPGSASPDNHGIQTAMQSHHDHAALSGRHRVLHVDLDADCDSGLGCCVMTLCHPGLSVDPQDMPVIAADDDTSAASMVRGVGSDPGVVLPPPRRFPL